MNLSQLKYIVEIEKTGSISRAAANLYMNQPHLSKSVRELEDSLGVTLFYRSSRGVIPTEQGNRILEYAKRILTQVKEIEDICSGGSLSKLTFSLAAPGSAYISEALTTFVSEFDMAIPFSVDYREANNAEAAAMVEQRQCSLGIVRCSAEDERFILPSVKFNTKTIWEFEHKALISEKSPYAKGQSMTQEQLSNCTEILRGNDSRRDYGGEMEVSNSRIAVHERTARLELLSKMPKTYMWTSPMPKKQSERYGLVQLPFEDSKGLYRDLLIYRCDYKLTETEEKFVEILKTTAKKILRDEI